MPLCGIMLNNFRGEVGGGGGASARKQKHQKMANCISFRYSHGLKIHSLITKGGRTDYEIPFCMYATLFDNT